MIGPDSMSCNTTVKKSRWDEVNWKKFNVTSSASPGGETGILKEITDNKKRPDLHWQKGNGAPSTRPKLAKSPTYKWKSQKVSSGPRKQW